MGLKFDEAVNMYDGDDLDFLIEQHQVIDIIEQLREEYAPTVEMTEIQKNALVEFKENWAFTQFINAVEGNYENNMYFKKVEEAFLKMRINNGYMIDENELMQAWLHPETIKVVDE